MPKVTVVYTLKDNSLDSGDLRQITVNSPSLHVGEVEQAVADHHGTDYKKITAIKMWKA
jgi:hypothetical protein